MLQTPAIVLPVLRSLTPPTTGGGGAGFTLVGAGAVSDGAVGAAVTPAWGAGSRTAGNLLIACVTTSSASAQSLPATPSGWSVGVQLNDAGLADTATVFYKLAAGSDTAPTFAGLSSNYIDAMLMEWSGNASSSPLDQHATRAFVAAGSVTITNGGTDTSAHELTVAVAWCFTNNAATNAVSNTMSNGAIATNYFGASARFGSQFGAGTGVTTSNASATTDLINFTGGGTPNISCVIASFKHA